MPSWLPLIILALACPIGMGLMMWFMMRMNRGQHQEPMTTTQRPLSPEEKLVRLEAEKQALEQQIAAAKNDGTGGRQPTPTSRDK